MVSTNKKSKVESTQTTPVLELHWRVLVKIVQTIGSLRAESGGALGGKDGEMEVSRYHFDRSSRTSSVTYTPDHGFLNRLFSTSWNPRGIRFRGFVHSHPGSIGRPSCGDEVYAERILSAIKDLKILWLPIVNTVPDTGAFRLTPWMARRAGRGVVVERALVRVVGSPRKSSVKVAGKSVLDEVRGDGPLDAVVVGEARHPSDPAARSTRTDSRNRYSTPDGTKSVPPSRTRSRHSSESMARIGETFDRVRDAYDLPLMNDSRVLLVGVGGGADYAEMLSRAGVGQFVLIDPDEVTETNLATQQVYRRDIGRPKVDCVAERIRDINPATRTVALKKALDELSDDEIRRFSLDPIDERRPRRTVICGLTDDFFAQARVNRLALELALPSLCAQVYKEGRGAEVTFTYPGVTPACHRCVLSSRYRYFAEGGKNEVTSHGTPIFATSRLNAIKGFVTLAILHHGSSHPRWGGMLSRIGKRNLIQLRLDPDIARTVGIGVFDKVFEKADHERLFFDEPVWLPQDAESPETGHETCPDCGGTGDLRSVEGRLGDTRRGLPVRSVGRPRRKQ